MSIRELTMREGAPKRRTLTDVLNGGAVPSLTLVHQVATALGVHAWELMKERSRAEESPATNIKHLPPRYRPIFAPQQSGRTEGKIGRKTKSRT